MASKLTNRNKFLPLYKYKERVFTFDRHSNSIVCLDLSENYNYKVVSQVKSNIENWTNKTNRDRILEKFDMFCEAIELHDELNPVIWDENKKLKADIKEKILEIAEEFKKNISDYLDLNIVDIEIVGSNAAYNYTDKSDVDVHIITNYNDYGQPEELVNAAMNANKANFNKSYDITFKGFNVELYVQDVKSMVTSNGIYSVYKDEWIKEPIKQEMPEVNLEPELSKKIKEIEELLVSGTYSEIENCINQLYIDRRHSLAKDGEFGKENLIFKEVRNLDLLDKLKLRLVELRSKELSVESKQIKLSIK